MYAFFVLMSIQQKIIMSCKSFAEHGRSCVGISLEQPDKAKPIIDLLRGHDSLEIMEWSKQRTSGMEERKPRGVAWGPRTRVRWWRRPTLGGVVAASSVWRAEWRGRGEESAKNARKKMALVYICHAPLLPVPSPHRE